MTQENFIKAHNSYFGEQADNVKQLAAITMSGEELYNFLQFCNKETSDETIKKWANENIIVEHDSENVRFLIFNTNKKRLGTAMRLEDGDFYFCPAHNDGGFWSWYSLIAIGYILKQLNSK